MDVKIKDDNQVFNYCARALIEQDGKLLIICVNDADYYHLPGGHVEIGEESAQALQREIQEEVGFAVTLDRLVLVSEQFYTKKDIKNHSIIFYYTARPQGDVPTVNSVRMEQGHTRINKNELRWVTRDELKDLDVRPVKIKTLILANQWDQLQHFVDRSQIQSND